MEAAFSVWESFENYVSGIFQWDVKTAGSRLGGHAVTIVGWGTENGTDYWRAANSWNPYWGENGYFRIIRSSTHAGAYGPGCGIQFTVYANAPGAKWGKV